MSQFWATWWQVVVLIALWVGLQSAMVRFYNWIKHVVAPHGERSVRASKWLRAELDAHGLDDVEVLRAPEGVNAFIPQADTVALDETIHGGYSTFFYAVAAHELGHVLVYHRSLPARWILFWFARSARELLASLGRTAMVANVLFGASLVSDFALGTLELGLICGVFVLVDEALATAVGLVSLRGNAFTAREWLAATTGLVAAFLTYIAAVVADLVFFVYFEDVARRIEGVSFVAGEPLGGLATVCVAVLGVWIAVQALIASAALATQRLLGVLRWLSGPATYGLGVLVVLILTWDLAVTPLGQLFFCLACLAVIDAVLLPFQFVLALIAVTVSHLENRVGAWLRGRREAAAERGAFLESYALSSAGGVLQLRFMVWLGRAAPVPWLVWYALA